MDVFDVDLLLLYKQKAIPRGTLSSYIIYHISYIIYHISYIIYHPPLSSSSSTTTLPKKTIILFFKIKRKEDTKGHSNSTSSSSSSSSSSSCPSSHLNNNQQLYLINYSLFKIFLRTYRQTYRHRHRGCKKMEQVVSTDYLLQDSYLIGGYHESIESPQMPKVLEPSTPTFFGGSTPSGADSGFLQQVSSPPTNNNTTSSPPTMQMMNNNNNNNNNNLVSSSNPTPLLVSQPPQQQFQQNPSPSVYNPHLQDPQTHEHFLNLLTQIKQTQQTLSSFQTNHEFINAQTAAAVAAQQVVLPAAAVTITTSDSVVVVEEDGNSTDASSKTNHITNTIALAAAVTNKTKGKSTEANLTISMPSKKNIKASAIASPPNSPRKSSRNSKVKHKTQQVQNHITQIQLQQQQSQSSPSTLVNTSSLLTSQQPPTFKLSGSPVSSPPQSPLTPPPTTSGKKNSGGSSTNNNSRLKKSTSSTLTNNFNNNTNNNNNVNSSSSSLNNNSLNTSGNAIKNIPDGNLGQSTAGSEDKKHICQSFLKYYLKVNPALSTPTLRRSLILSLYVNKIPQDLRYRRPNDMANLCVVLYGYLYSSLDENTIREFINTHSSSSTRIKRDDKKKKRKRDKEGQESGSDGKFSPNLDKSSTVKSQRSSSLDQDPLWPGTSNSLQTTTSPTYNFYGSSTSPETNGVLSPNAATGGSTFFSADQTTAIQQDITMGGAFVNSGHSISNQPPPTQPLEDNEKEVSLHEAFINCVKSCNLLPFIEFKPVQELTTIPDFPLSGGECLYAFEDLVRWENEIKDQKLSIKQSQQQLQQQQQQLQQHQNQQTLLQQQQTLQNQQKSIYQQPDHISLTATLQQLQQQQKQMQSSLISSPLLTSSSLTSPLISSSSSSFQQQPQQQMLQSNPLSPTQMLFQTQQQPIQNQQQSLLSPPISFGLEEDWKNLIVGGQQQQQATNSLMVGNGGGNDMQQTMAISNNPSITNSVLINVYENEESFVIYAAIPHSKPNNLRVTVNQMEVIIEGTISLPESVYLPNGSDMLIPVSYPYSQKQEFAVGPFTKMIPLSCPVSSSVVGKKEGIVVIIARKEILNHQFGY
ncbi:hypothetical protein DFA_08465 [Cavenderia fasciculata]|uniref:SHSP domain-containing protein n=1 Tax=Cavenderia fasciculata TaxID=261658 RepID=F4Q695_CACFS|nr:uncharacterized protein DFA_08465 [Cavenderia fasciculata]EGG17469.1 hypothetical protein DFA_08465 [Cavenderia fasciculata]|eukprot:XP_004355953.1 hypothetical protein DFA_08465 [Cavenderia fasciculata]